MRSWKRSSTCATPPKPARAGFILPVAVILVLFLTISGFGFLQLEFLERRATTNEQDNHAAFELGSAGLERMRDDLKIPTEQAVWTQVLEGSIADHPSDLPPDDPRLCPDVSRGCVIPSFQTVARNPLIVAADGDPIVSPDAPFEATFANGLYSVRAFNNSENPSLCPGPGTRDCDQVLTLRALGAVRGAETVVEASVFATTGLGLVTCGDTSSPVCPDSIRGSRTTLEYLDGRDPRSVSDLPTMQEAFYSNPANFPMVSAVFSCGSGIDCSRSTIDVPVSNGGFYLIEGLPDPEHTTVQVSTSGRTVQSVVVFSEASVEVHGRAQFSNSVFASLDDIQLQGNVSVFAPVSPERFPAIVSGGNVGADHGVRVTGNIYSAGIVDFNPITVTGIIVGQAVHLQGNTLIRDGGNPAFYSLMPGFTYPPELLTTQTVPRTWREIE